MMSALRPVQIFIIRKGQKRGKKVSQRYRLREKNLIMRDKYFKRMMEEEKGKTRTSVYMDESNIHGNYCSHEEFLYNPNDAQDLKTVATHKGQRYCFIAAIMDADHPIPEKSKAAKQKAGLLMDTLDIFKMGKSKREITTGFFDHHNFRAWMRKFLATLKSRNITDAIIFMDNAKYHKKFPEGTPRMNEEKSRLQDACEEYGVAFDMSDTSSILGKVTNVL